MNKREVGIESRLKTNPFIEDLRIPIRKDEKFTILSKKDEWGVRKPKEVFIDKSPHVRLFYDTDIKGVVLHLSEKAKTLFLYIVYNLKSGKDYIDLNCKEYAAATGVRSRSTFGAAKEELWLKKFIEPTAVRSIYFINPAHFFCGSRPYWFPDNTTDEPL